MSAWTIVVGFVLNLAVGLLCYWLGWSRGRKLLAEEWTAKLLAKPNPRAYEERLLAYAELERKRPADKVRVVW